MPLPQHLKEASGFLNRYSNSTFPEIEKFLNKSGILEKPHELKQFRPLQSRNDDVILVLPELTLVSPSLEDLRNTRPSLVKVKSVTLSIEFGIRNAQIFSSLNVAVTSSCADPRYCCFHIDTMPPASANNRFPHPFHHLQFGGEHLGELGVINPEHYGKLLFVDTPRISVPPMDLSIALHFLCSNFLPSNVYSIKQYPGFESQIKLAQKHLWAPFFRTISNYWNAGDLKLAEQYLPQLVG